MLTSFRPLFVGADGYCSTWSHSMTHTRAHTHSVGLLWTRDTIYLGTEFRMLSRSNLLAIAIPFIAYLLTPWCRVLLEKLTGMQLVKKLPAFHGTRRFSAALTSVRHLSLSRASPIQSIYTSHLLEIRSNIIRPSTPRSSHWSPSLRFPHQDPKHPPLLNHTTVYSYL